MTDFFSYMPYKVTIVEHSWIAKLAAKKLKSDTMAITIGNKIHLHNTSKAAFLQSTSWLCHELKHVQQFRQYGYFKFMFKYLLESLKKGYYKNKWELEARAAENDLSLLKEFEIC